MAFGSTNLTSNRSVFDDPDPIGQLLGEGSNPRQMTRKDYEEAAQAKGYQIVGGRAMRYGPGGIPSYRDLNSFQSSKPNPLGSLANLPPILLEALRSDTSRMDSAGKEQHGRLRGQEDVYRKALGEGVGDIREMGVTESGRLRDAAGRAEALGADQRSELTGRADAMVGRVRGDVDKALSQMPEYYKGLDKAHGDIDEAYRLGDESVKEYARGMSEYKDLSAQNMSATASAIRRGAYTQMQQVRSGLGPDGNPIPAEQQMAMMEQLKFQTGQQVQEQIAPLQNSFNDNMMQLRGQLAALQQGNAGFRLQGASLRGNLEGQRLQGVGMEVQGAQIKSQAEQYGLDTVAKGMEAQRQLVQIGSTLREMASNTASAAVMKAVELEINGQANLSQLMMQNPKSVVSWFQGLLAMMTLNKTMSPIPSYGGGGGGGGDSPTTPNGGAQQQQRPQTGGFGQSNATMGQPGGVGAGYGYTSLAARKRGLTEDWARRQQQSGIVPSGPEGM